jgi:phytoene synthase
MGQSPLVYFNASVSYGLRMSSSSARLSALQAHVRRADPDRFFCTVFAPPARREILLLLYAFNHELARAREVASEPVLALIRLNWWRDVVQGHEKPHPIATPLAAALAAGSFQREDLLALIAAREIEAEPEIPDVGTFYAYARATSGRLARIAGKLLGADSDAVEDLGTAYGIAGLLRAAPFHARQHRRLLPADHTPPEQLIAHARALLTAKPPACALPAALPAVYARRDLGKPYGPRGLGDRLAVIRAALTGRI